MIAASKSHELHTKIHNILNNAVSEWVGNMTCILACIFNSAPRQHCEVWTSQFPFLHNIKDSVPPSEACLYDNFQLIPGAGPPPILLWTVPVLNLCVGCQC